MQNEDDLQKRVEELFLMMKEKGVMLGTCVQETEKENSDESRWLIADSNSSFYNFKEQYGKLE